VTIKERFPKGITVYELRRELAHLSGRIGRLGKLADGIESDTSCMLRRELLKSTAADLWALVQLDLVDPDGALLERSDPLDFLQHCPYDPPF
jgi:hypothetical protein